jgi:TPR repeat protein
MLYLASTTGNAPEATQLYLKAAQRGNASAQTKMGDIYRSGWGGTQVDYAQAIYWFRKAAAQGSTSAEYSLGYMYQNGLGVEKNAKEAKGWYRKATADGQKQ